MSSDSRARLIAYLCQAGLSTARANAVIDDYSHSLAEKVRAESTKGRKSGLTRIYYRAAADMIDPLVHDDPLNVLRAIEEAPSYDLVPGCPHCPDGHTPPNHGQTWGAFVSPERDGDGQSMQIIVARSAGAHVAESDAEWVRSRLNDTADET